MGKKKQDEIKVQETEKPLEDNSIIEKALPEQEYNKSKKNMRKKIALGMIALLAIEVASAAFYVNTIMQDNIHHRVVREVRYQIDDKLVLKTGTFTGDLDFGVFSGNGEFIFDTGSVYEGEWADNYFDGLGKLQVPSEGVYEGKFIIYLITNLSYNTKMNIILHDCIHIKSC